MKFHFSKTEPFPGVPLQDWNSWTWQFRNGLSQLADFEKHFELSEQERLAFRDKPAFQIRTTPYYAALASRAGAGSNDPIRRMVVPTVRELEEGGQQVADPLGEQQHSPRERLIHRYPDRVLFLVTDQCSLYCRYCLRKHFTGNDSAFVGSNDYAAALTYLRGATGVREVILSGGDPLTLADSRLEKVVGDLRAIDHIEMIRIATRMPVVCPMRVTDETVKMLRKFKPVYLMTHFNHPRELSHEAAEALERFVDHGIPAFNQMVLLNGINNHAAIVQALSRRLIYLRVKPYYMFQCDPSEGSEHFRTSVEESMAIQRELWGRLSGLAMPNLSLDIPGGGGKVGIVPEFETQPGEFVGWDGKSGIYSAPQSPAHAPSDIESYLEEWNSIKSQPYGKR